MKGISSIAVLPKKINYLKYGDALEKLKIVKEYKGPQTIRKEQLIKLLNDNRTNSSCTKHVVEGYGGVRRKTINVQKLIVDID